MNILVQHDGLVVVDKPAGLASTGRSMNDPDCVQSLLMSHLGRRKVWAVHQLDTGTTGLNLFVTRKALVAEWSARLAEAVGRKRYFALCHGVVVGDEHVIALPIGKIRTKTGRSLSAITKKGQPARSVVRVLARGQAYTAVEVEIVTGRTHQVRLHLAHTGHPIVGEHLHRDPPCRLHGRPALHAWKLDFSDGPSEVRHLVAPIPDDLQRLARQLAVPLPT